MEAKGKDGHVVVVMYPSTGMSVCCMLYIVSGMVEQLMVALMIDLDRPCKGLDFSKCSFL